MRVARSVRYLLAMGLPLLILAAALSLVTLLSSSPIEIVWIVFGYFVSVAFSILRFRRRRRFFRDALTDCRSLGADDVVVSPFSGIVEHYVPRWMVVTYVVWGVGLAIGFSTGVWPGMCATVSGLALGVWTLLTGVPLVIVIRWQRRHGTPLFETVDAPHAYYTSSVAL